MELSRSVKKAINPKIERAKVRKTGEDRLNDTQKGQVPKMT